MVQKSIPFCYIFPYLDLYYYSHWSNIELYIWSTASSVGIIIFLGGSVIHLVTQETIILWKRQNTNNIVNNISGIKSKYLSHEPPTPNQFPKRSSRLGNGSFKAEIWFFIRFSFTRNENMASTLNCSTDISLRCCKVLRALWLCSTAFLIIEISEFNKLIAQLVSFKLYESC